MTISHVAPTPAATDVSNTLPVPPVATGALLFYSSVSKQFATGTLSASGAWKTVTPTSDVGAFGAWTHIVGAGNGALLFYSSVSKQFATGTLSASGAWKNVTPTSDVGAFGAWTHIVGGIG
jgi:hypothetical protein